jgi:hypothetical protein
MAALGSDTLGSRSVAVGSGALSTQNFTTATNAYNTAVGYGAGDLITTGQYNTLMGGEAGDALTTGNQNVAVGYNSLTADTLGDRNVAIGVSTLTAQNFTTTTDAYNTAVGALAGTAVTTGVQNTFVGGLAGDGTDDGTNNVAVGFEALSANCGSGNTTLGTRAGKITTGDDNTFVDFVGNTAGTATTSGASNTCVGNAAGSAITTGGNNLFLGKDAGLTGSPGGNFTTENHRMVLGDENMTNAHIQVALTVASDQRDKTDFTALDLGLDFVKDLKPVTYKWDKRSKYGDKKADDYDLNAQSPDGTHKEDWLDIGFKAQEVEALEIAAGYNKSSKTNLVSSHSGDGKQMGLQYSKFVPILVKAIQEQQTLIESLTARITTLEG